MARGRVVYGRKNRYFADDIELSRAEFDKMFPNRLADLLESARVLPAHTQTCWPMVSEALAVHPKQVAAANARNKRHGVNVTYMPNGLAVVPGRGERKKLLRLEGMHDNSGGYGD